MSFTLVAVIALLFVVLVIRAGSFKSRQVTAEPTQTLAISRAAAVAHLSQAIQLKTVSLKPPAANAGEFVALHALIARAFPHINRQLNKETVGEHSLLFTWQGKDHRLKPMLLMAHIDVVPVDPTTESSWHYAPFSGEIADGYIWGRGAMDDKGSVFAILEAVESLLTTNFRPERTMYLAFGHDEEIGGINGAAKIAALLRARHVELESILDEGLNVFTGIISGLDAPVALIGIAEKGYLSLQLSVESAGGHSSMPPEHTAIGALIGALQKLQDAPFPARLNRPTREMFEFLGPEMPFDKKLVLANLWLFSPLVEKTLAQSPRTNALLRTTLAPTMLNGGITDNVLPSKASAVVNLRIVPGESTASASQYVRQAIADPTVSILPLSIHWEPSAVSNVDAASFAILRKTIRQTIPTAVVGPALLVASTDSRHYRSLTKNIFRFLPVTVGPHDISRYHGIDERISVEDYERCIRFYAQLIINANAPMR
ncbi:MAG TPA: M20 family peptidase [Candidatus Binatia bacterium]|nr:M20 family peptidase [Candidatus Binatia bacterium]